MAGVALSVISALSAGNKKIVSSVRDKNNSHGDWREDIFITEETEIKQKRRTSENRVILV